MIKSIIKKFFRYIRIHNNSLIILKCPDLRSIPELPVISYKVRKIDSKNNNDISLWIELMKNSFERNNMNESDFYNNIINHPYYNVIASFFLLDQDKPIGVISAGFFKKNNTVGVTHYLGIKKNYRGKNLGKYLVLYALHFLRNNGFVQCEAETFLSNKESVGIHIKYGFLPKPFPDKWNTDDKCNFISKRLTINELNKLYESCVKP